MVILYAPKKLAKDNPFAFSFLSPGTGGVWSGTLFKNIWNPGYIKPVTQAGFPWLVAGGGAAVGILGTTFLGKKGQEQAVAQAVDQKLDQKQDLSAALKPSYNVGGDWQPANDLRTYNQYDIISGGTGSIYSEKKIEAQGGQTPAWSMPNIISQTPSQAGSQGASQGSEQGQTAGTDMIWLAAIAAVGIIGFGYFSGKGKKHEKTK